ncbi:MAG: YcaO-like family protein [Deltaproteobacteria bacterium]|nr:YcaO-like family protein [Deltaproteobacteria bacterium]
MSTAGQLMKLADGMFLAGNGDDMTIFIQQPTSGFGVPKVQMLLGLNWDLAKGIAYHLRETLAADLLLDRLQQDLPNVPRKELQQSIEELVEVGVVLTNQAEQDISLPEHSVEALRSDGLRDLRVAMLATAERGRATAEALANAGFAKLTWAYPYRSADSSLRGAGAVDLAILAEEPQRIAKEAEQINARELFAEPVTTNSFKVRGGNTLYDGLQASAPFDLLLVVADHLDAWSIAHSAHWARGKGVHVLVGRTEAHYAEVSPFYRAGSSPCHMCYAQRLSENFHHIARPLRRYLLATPDLTRKNARLSKPLATLLANRALEGFEQLKRAESGNSAGAASIAVFDAASGKVHSKMLLASPTCIECGRPAASYMLNASNWPKERFRVELQERTARFHENGERLTSAEEVVEMLEPYTGKVGPISEINASADDIACGLPVYYTPSKRVNLPTLKGLRTKDGGNAGKGFSPGQARASALCESLERYASQAQGDEPLIEASYAEVAQDAIPAAAFGLEAEYPEEQICWFPGFSLTQQRTVLVPATAALLTLPESQSEHPTFWTMSGRTSNGLSCGVFFEDAILQGLLEVIERDQYAPFELTGLGLTELQIGDRLPASCQAFWQRIKRDGLTCRLFLANSDLPFYTILCAVFDDHYYDKQRPMIAIGSGCHLSADIALARAISESIQQRTTKHRLHTIYGDTTQSRNDELLAVVFEKKFPSRPYGELTDQRTGTMHGDIIKCVQTLEQHGFETIVVDLSNAHVPMKVVRVIVPGLVFATYWSEQELASSTRVREILVKQGLLERFEPSALLTSGSIVNGEPPGEEHLSSYLDLIRSRL